MTDPLRRYFRGEKRESALFAVVGVAALAVAASLLDGGPAAHGAAGALSVLAAVEIAIGATVFRRTDAQVAALDAARGADLKAFRDGELVRMRRVIRRFGWYQRLELVLLVAGLLLAFARARSLVLHGVGLSLLGQSSLLFALDLFAEARGRRYVAWLEGLAWVRRDVSAGVG